MKKPGKKRNYKQATKFEDSAKEVKQREERNKARYDVAHHLHTAIKGSLKGKDVDHRDPLRHHGSNAPSNWDLRSIHANRGDNKS